MESLEQKYAQTLENSNLSLKQRQVLLSSLKLFSEIGFQFGIEGHSYWNASTFTICYDKRCPVHWSETFYI